MSMYSSAEAVGVVVFVTAGVVVFVTAGVVAAGVVAAGVVAAGVVAAGVVFPAGVTSTLTSYIVRTVVSACEPAAQNAAKSCSPIKQLAARLIASVSTGPYI